MKLPEFRGEPHYLHWLVRFHLQKDLQVAAIAAQEARRGAVALAEYVDQLAMIGRADVSLGADVLRFALSLVDWQRLARELREGAL